MPCYLVPLGCDYNKTQTGIGPQTSARCVAALEYGRYLRSYEEEVVFVLAPGIEPARRHRSDGGKTMAMMMQAWFCEQGEAALLVNVQDTDLPFDTAGEVSWSLETIRHDQHERNRQSPNSLQWNAMNDVEVVFVSNRRHLFRVWWILWLLHGLPRSVTGAPDAYTPDGVEVWTKPEITWHYSREPAPTFWHECGAYLKLGLLWLGVYRWAR